MAIETFGVNSALIQTYGPQLGVGSTYPVTDARIGSIIEGAAAEVYGQLSRIYGASIISTITADTASPQYRLCQQFIIDITMPRLLFAAFGPSSDVDIEFYNDRAREAKARLQLDPIGELGLVTETMSTSVGSSTKYLNLDVTSTERVRARRKFDSRGHGKDEGGFTW